MENNRKDFMWRPNDNSSTTLTRYSLEAEHWVNALKSVEINNRSNNDFIFGFIGGILHLIMLIITMILMGIIDIIKWYRTRNEPKKVPHEPPSIEELDRRWDELLRIHKEKERRKGVNNNYIYSEEQFNKH